MRFVQPIVTFIIFAYFVIVFTCFLKTMIWFDIKDQQWAVQTSFSNSNTTTTVESVSYTIVQKSTTDPEILATLGTQDTGQSHTPL
jgi:cytochrome b subunit of formate dehydrogenase